MLLIFSWHVLEQDRQCQHHTTGCKDNQYVWRDESDPLCVGNVGGLETGHQDD